MVYIPFCYKVWGVSIDEDGNEDYGFIKLSMTAKSKISKENYEKLREHYKKWLQENQNEDVIPISVEEYIAESECDEEELSLLKNDFIL